MILLGRSLEIILRSAAEKSSREINSSTYSSSVGNNNHGHDSYFSSGREDGDEDGQELALQRDVDREKFFVFEVRHNLVFFVH